ncbi:MAG: hypothetical protein KF889_17955 [Alphaproteobacteria bacterium]|nr:hypothetical protein [Alphaproteobacteria bacterium]MCW5741338.1 hypothetical protein [Alphaproteobacteria bacterium]
MRSPIAALFALACLSAPAFAMSETECTDLWKKADANGDGVLSDEETGRYLAGMRMHQVRIPEDGRIDQQVFMDNCKRDVFKTAANDPGAPLKGANSFTQGQAKDRALARGYTDVSELKKDDAGIWRGTATMDGKSVGIAIDYKGNVVSDAGGAPAATPTTTPAPATPAPATTPAPTTPTR